MWSCPNCGYENEGTVRCRNCGFDDSLNYKKYCFTSRLTEEELRAGFSSAAGRKDPLSSGAGFPDAGANRITPEERRKNSAENTSVNGAENGTANGANSSTENDSQNGAKSGIAHSAKNGADSKPGGAGKYLSAAVVLAFVLAMAVFVVASFMSNRTARDPEALYQKGLSLYNEGKYEEAVTYFQAAASHGNASAQFWLGFMYEKGLGGLEQSDEEAVNWFRKAAEQGNASAQAWMGYMYENGLGGLEQSDEEAVTWYQKAAEQGDEFAQTRLDALESSEQESEGDKENEF